LINTLQQPMAENQQLPYASLAGLNSIAKEMAKEKMAQHVTLNDLVFH
jgi:hypothetical protein